VTGAPRTRGTRAAPAAADNGGAVEPTEAAAGNAGSLFGGPIWTEAAHAYRAELRRDLESHVLPLVARAEESRSFPREALRFLGDRDHLRRRWRHPGPHGDLGYATIFSNELGRLLAGGLAAGVSVHTDSAITVLRGSSADSGFVRQLYEDAIAARRILCIGISEPSSGSDPSRFTTRATEQPDGSWIIRGRKKFISLSKTADYALVLARTGDAAHNVAFFAVPHGPSGYVVRRELGKHGTHSVETCEFDLDSVRLAPDHLLVGGGAALGTLTRALNAERLSVCSQLVGALETCLEITRGYLRARPARSGTLWNFQALRHRFADLLAEHKVLQDSVTITALAAQQGGAGQQAVAALKLAVAPRVERAISEAMQMLGGLGYLDDLPVERALRDVRLARIAAGTDDVMREIVATRVLPDEQFRRLISIGEQGEPVVNRSGPEGLADGPAGPQ
jgi:acyl-ACP dehydrogenase